MQRVYSFSGYFQLNNICDVSPQPFSVFEDLLTHIVQLVSDDLESASEACKLLTKIGDT